MGERVESSRFFVGVHFRRHFGGPGHLDVGPGELVLTDRRGRRRLRHAGSVVRVERKRWEPPTGNHWVEVVAGADCGWATVPRRRAERIVAALEASGFTVERV